MQRSRSADDSSTIVILQTCDKVKIFLTLAFGMKKRQKNQATIKNINPVILPPTMRQTFMSNQI